MKKKTHELHALIPRDLYGWVKKYAKGQHTNVTNLIISYFSDLKLKDESRVEQI